MVRLWRSTIARRLFVSFLIVFLAITGVSLAVNYIGISILSREVNTYYNNSLTLLTKQLDNNLKNLEVVCNLILTDDKLNVINYRPEENADSLLEYKEYLDNMKFLAAANEVESNITIYLKNKGRVLSTKSGAYFINKKEIENMLLQNTSIFQKWALVLNGENEKVLTLLKNNAVQNSESGIVVVIDIEIIQIKMLLSNLEKQAGGTAFLVINGTNDVFFSGKDRVNSKELISSINKPLKIDNQFLVLHNNVKYRTIFKRSEYAGVVLGVYYPEQHVMEPIIKVRNWILIIFIISLLFGIGFTFYSYHSLIQPIYGLVKGMEIVSKGDFKAHIHTDKKGEMKFIAVQFNSMVEKIDELINEAYIEKLNKQQIQLKFLQSQINPHFLHNCLNFIYQMSMCEDNESIAEMSLYLSKYFRFATRSNKDTVTLKEEMESVDAYMNIQKMRFPKKFSYTIQISQDIHNIVIPRLVVQPIVENAFVHGLENLKRSGSISITCKYDEESIQLIIEDDGVGIELEKLNELRCNLGKMSTNERGYGICNTHLRLRLKYGEKSGLHIEQREQIGTRIVIIIPRIEGDDSKCIIF